MFTCASCCFALPVLFFQPVEISESIVLCWWGSGCNIFLGACSHTTLLALLAIAVSSVRKVDLPFFWFCWLAGSLGEVWGGRGDILHCPVTGSGQLAIWLRPFWQKNTLVGYGLHKCLGV